MIVPTWIIASYLSPVKSKLHLSSETFFPLFLLTTAKLLTYGFHYSCFFNSNGHVFDFFLYSFENSLMNTSEMFLFLVRMVYIAKPNPNTYLPAIEIIALLE